MKIGDLELISLSDGEARMPPQYFPNADWSVHQNLLNEDGLLILPLGCFVVRSADRIVLVDAGLGPVESPLMSGGQLPARLDAAGISPSDIDLVLLTHLHLDHIGWVVRDGRSFFEKATVRFGSDDWDHFVAACPDHGDFTRQTMEFLKSEGKIELIHGDGAIAPGIDVVHAPGHTPGHLCAVVSSGIERALLLGDAVTCPIQVEETEWQAISDVDPGLAKRTRENLWRELEASGAISVGAHFPGLKFGRVLTTQGKRYFS